MVVENGGNVNVSSGTLKNVGRNFGEVASDVRTIFNGMKNTIEQVTSHESWSTESSKIFLDKFNNISPMLEQHLQELESLESAIEKTATGYTTAEEDSIGIMHG